jgi:hypothetical protein
VISVRYIFFVVISINSFDKCDSIGNAFLALLLVVTKTTFLGYLQSLRTNSGKSFSPT